MENNPKPLFFLADSQLLFVQGQGNYFRQSVIKHLNTQRPRAAYIGASNGDNPDYYSIFKAAMDGMGIKKRQMISSKYPRKNQLFLEQADLIVLSGGEIDKGWEIFTKTGIKDTLLDRYHNGAVLLGISAGAVQLGLKGWDQKGNLFDTLKLAPFQLDVHDEANAWTRLLKMVNTQDKSVLGIGIQAGGGMIFYPDQTIEPVQKPLIKFKLHNGQIAQDLPSFSLCHSAFVANINSKRF